MVVERKEMNWPEKNGARVHKDHGESRLFPNSDHAPLSHWPPALSHAPWADPSARLRSASGPPPFVHCCLPRAIMHRTYGCPSRVYIPSCPRTIQEKSAHAPHIIHALIRRGYLCPGPIGKHKALLSRCRLLSFRVPPSPSTAIFNLSRTLSSRARRAARSSVYPWLVFTDANVDGLDSP